VPLSPFQFWQDCIINTSGYDFRKGQVALFYLADATLEKGAPPVVTSERVGLPKSWQPDPIQTLVSAPAPEPDMTSSEVLAAQPKSEAEVGTSPKKKRVTRKQLPDDAIDRTRLGRETEIAVRLAVSSLADSE